MCQELHNRGGGRLLGHGHLSESIPNNVVEQVNHHIYFSVGPVNELQWRFNCQVKPVLKITSKGGLEGQLLYLMGITHIYCIFTAYRINMDTIFCRINVPAWINAPPTFDLNWLYLEDHWTDPNQIFSTQCSGTQGAHSEFQPNQTGLRVRFVPPHTAHLFGEIQ